jgi:hypothetical protein
MKVWDSAAAAARGLADRSQPRQQCPGLRLGDRRGREGGKVEAALHIGLRKVERRSKNAAKPNSASSAVAGSGTGAGTIIDSSSGS